jgi:hypothetical protein
MLEVLAEAYADEVEQAKQEVFEWVAEQTGVKPEQVEKAWTTVTAAYQGAKMLEPWYLGRVQEKLARESQEVGRRPGPRSSSLTRKPKRWRGWRARPHGDSGGGQNNTAS